MRRLILILFVVSMFVIVTTNHNSVNAHQQIDGCVLYGDVDQNGVVNVSDLLAMANTLVGNTTLSQTQWTAANIYMDSRVDTLDLLTLANFLVGNIQHLPVYPGD